MTGDWRKAHNEELHNLYCSSIIIRVIKWRRMGWAGHVVCMGREKKCIQDFGGKIYKKKTIQKTQDNINMGHKETGLEGMDWINLLAPEFYI